MSQASPVSLNLISRILYGNDISESTYRDIQELLRLLGTPDLIIHYPNVRQTNIPTSYTTPLIAAILRQSPRLVQFLLNSGANPNFGGGAVIGNPMDYAIYIQNPTIIDLLTQHGARAQRPVTSRPEEMRFRQPHLLYQPGGLGAQQAQSEFYGYASQSQQPR